jgi:hypothetical protein
MGRKALRSLRDRHTPVRTHSRAVHRRQISVDECPRLGGPKTSAQRGRGLSLVPDRAGFEPHRR